MRMDNECAICLCDNQDNEQNNHEEWVQTSCQHQFHRECILKWMKTESSNKKCPQCRSDL